MPPQMPGTMRSSGEHQAAATPRASLSLGCAPVTLTRPRMLSSSCVWGWARPCGKGEQGCEEEEEAAGRQLHGALGSRVCTPGAAGWDLRCASRAEGAGLAPKPG